MRGPVKSALGWLRGRRKLQTLSSLDAYARWASQYPPHAHNALMAAEQAAVEALLPDLAGRAIVDLACGTGRYGLLAEAGGARQAIGLDNSRAMLLAGALRAVQASAEAIPLGDGWADGLICGLALGHLAELGPPLAEIARVLRPGGWAVISDFHPFLFLTGRQRVFTAEDGKSYAVEHYPHLVVDYVMAGAAVGLTIEAMAEPSLSEKDDLQGAPVVLVIRFRKLMG
jgi:malonyl-CoA O-methyltransferase